MSPRVTITLTALNGNLDPAVRVFDLDVDRNSVSIGRASKTVSKGLQSAHNNAWFDSPVMSRDHAELLLDLETEVLAIQDIGSMHGTFLNGSRIPVNHLSQLHDGDKVVFGTEVRRGIEIFPACEFRFNCEISSDKATNTYSFPETSDNEEVEEEMGFSDVESEDDGVSSEDDESVIAVGHKVSQSNQAINLNRYDSPLHHSYTRIDLTGDAAAARSDVSLDCDVDTDEEIGPTIMDDDFYVRHDEEPKVAEGPNCYSSDYENEDPAEEEADGAGVADNLPAGAYELDDKEIESSVYDYDSDMGSASSQEDVQVLTSDYVSSPTVIKGADRMVGTDDEHNDFGLPEAAAEGMRVLTDNALLQSPYTIMSSQYRYMPCWPGAAPITSTGELSHSPVVPDTFTSLSQLSSTSGAGRPTYSNRQPSPSDAAMAKGPEIKDSDIPVSYIRSSANLGVGSGKEEFFKARELNKATLLQHGSWSSRRSMTKSFETPANFGPTPPVRAIMACTPKRIRSLAMESISDTDNRKTTMMAAETFPVSKESVADSQTRPPFEPSAQPVRSGLRIDEIIDRDSSDQEPVPRKRKADEISDVVEDDIRVWASTLKSVDTTEAQEPAPTPTPTPTPTDDSVAFHSALSQTSEQRPAKFRKLMENVAYAALGGVAVGAALFGSLVATAPDFM